MYTQELSSTAPESVVIHPERQVVSVTFTLSVSVSVQSESEIVMVKSCVTGGKMSVVPELGLPTQLDGDQEAL